MMGLLGNIKSILNEEQLFNWVKDCIFIDIDSSIFQQHFHLEAHFINYNLVKIWTIHVIAISTCQMCDVSFTKENIQPGYVKSSDWAVSNICWLLEFCRQSLSYFPLGNKCKQSHFPLHMKH